MRGFRYDILWDLSCEEREVNGPMIQVRCHNCRAESSIPADLAGQNIPCPECGVQVLAPGEEPGRMFALGLVGPAEQAAPPIDIYDGERQTALVVAAVSLVVGVPFIGLTWFFAGNIVLAIIAMLAIGISGFGFVGFALHCAASSFSGGKRHRLREDIWIAVLFLANFAVFSLCYYLHAFHRFIPIHVDNFSPRPVRVVVDGGDWVMAPAGKSVVASLRMGAYTIDTLSADGGQTLESMSVEVGRGPYVLNVLGAQTYARGSLQYGGKDLGQDDGEEEISDRWFQAGVDYLFETPPKVITVKKGEAAKGTRRTYLRRGPAKKG